MLVLGGTGFIGPHMVEYALERGHEVTLFNRGRTDPHLFPEAEKLIGDRNDDLTALEGRQWDVCMDNNANIPRWVRQSTEILKDSVQHYVYVSSLSVYSDSATVGQDETGPLMELPPDHPPDDERITGETFGAFKAIAERTAQAAFPGRCLVVRPTLIVGPRDRSDRFTYWPVRVQRGGEILAPGDGSTLTQYIDVRDLAQWMVRMAEAAETGVYNGLGPRSPITIAELLHGIRACVSNVELSFTWVDWDFLLSQEVRPWMEMTTVVQDSSEMAGFSTFTNHRAVAKGLTFRPLYQTVLDTLDWWHGRPEEARAQPRAGLAPEKEERVLAAWHARSSG
jgi:2'-hydroxyisoflavone reductase